MRTSDPDIFAVGDAVEVKDFGTGQWSLIALAGPANRQGRIAADVIAGRDSRYRGTQGTSIIGLFGGAAAWTGVGEKTLKRLGDEDYEKVYLFPNSHAGYYPGAKMLAMKFIFRKSNGKVLGAQALGLDGPAVDKRISALAVAIQMGATIYDLEESELCYAPQFGSAKDPVNFAGMVAADVLRGDMPLTHWDSADNAFLLDVREPVELAVESVPGAVNIPMGQLRSRLGELPQRPRNPRHLPLRPARLLCDAHSFAERVQGQEYFRRHAFARHAHVGFEVVARRDECGLDKGRDDDGHEWSQLNGAGESMPQSELKLVDMLALDRNKLAAERTLMAWVRTALSMISFGFTIYKFLQVIDEQSTVPVLRPNAPRNVGLVLTGLGNLRRGDRLYSALELRKESANRSTLQTVGPELHRGVPHRDSGRPALRKHPDPLWPLRLILEAWVASASRTARILLTSFGT